MGVKYSVVDQDLLISIFHNNFNKFQEIIQKVSDPNKTISVPASLSRSLGLPSDSNFPLLHILVHYSRKDLLIFLLSSLKNVKIDLQDQFGFTSLMKAVQSSKEDLVKLLLEKGADPLKPNQYDSGDSALHYACEAGDLKTMLVLLNTCPLIDQRNREGLTPLMYAVQRKHLKIVKTLIKMRADPYLTDFSGCNSLDYARSQKFNEKDLKVFEQVNQRKPNFRENNSNDTFVSYTERSFNAEETKNHGTLAFFIARGLDLLVSEQVSWV